MDAIDMTNGKTYLIVDNFHNSFYICRFDYFKLRKANTKGDIVIKDVITILEHAYNGKMFFYDEEKEVANSNLIVKELTGPFENAYYVAVQAVKYFMLVAEKSYSLFKAVNDMKAEELFTHF